MTKWWVLSLLLSCYGFLKEYRPSEPFISSFLTSHFKNFTNEQVTQEIYPIGIYCNLSLLVVVFLLTDLLRYKPVLIVGGLAGMVTWSLLIWGTTIPEMQIVEFFYGLFMASEVAYYTYIYSKVEKEHYQKVTSHTRTAYLLGKAGAGLSSQLFVHFHILDYLELNYVTVCALTLTTLVSILLPSVPQSIYFHRIAPSEENNHGADCTEEGLDKRKILARAIVNGKPKSVDVKFKQAFNYLYMDLKLACTNRYVVEWSLWWALATCGYLQIVTYCQLLWEEINKEEGVDLYNGLVEFTYSILGAGAAFGVGYLQLLYERWGEFILGVLTIIQGAFIYFAANATNLFVAYSLHIGYGILYQIAITIGSSEVAKNIKEDSYALIFGINTFIALILQTVLTAIVVTYLKCDIRTQFQIYGCYQFVFGSVFLLVGVFVLMKLWRQS